MGLSRRIYKNYIVLSTVIFFLVGVGRLYAADAGKEGEVGVKECEGVQLTQCELAKNLILTLKMGEDLPCDACFISLGGIDIAPGSDWSYADPHKVITLTEITEILVKIHSAYTKGMVRQDASEVVTGINNFCRGIKGTSPPPPASDVTERKKENTKQDETKSPPAGAPVSGKEQKGEK
jgi:hypothetical protein